jgi:hypothetical protein
MLGNGLGPWRSRFVYYLNTHFLIKNHISFSALSSKMITLTLRDAVQTMEQGPIDVPCINGDADKIRSANYETVLK